MIEFYGGYQVYSESGVDLTMLRENLKRSVTQRLENNSNALRLVAELQKAIPAHSVRGESVPRQAMQLNAEAILRPLAEHQVKYVLIGGLAMRVQGSVHITEDLDICYDRAPENVAAMAAALASLHPYLRGVPPGLPFRLDVPTILAGLNFTLTTDHGDVDLLGEVRGIGMYEQVLAQSEEGLLFGLTVRVLTLDGLLVSKRTAGRIKDRLHILELEELKKLRENPPQG
jgi:hypothetical protein